MWDKISLKIFYIIRIIFNNIISGGVCRSRKLGEDIKENCFVIAPQLANSKILLNNSPPLSTIG